MRETALTDWFWTPLLGERTLPVAIGTFVLVAILVIGAWWPGKAPGGVSRKERAWGRWWHVHSRPIRVFGTLLGVVGSLLAPAAICAGIFLLLYPLNQPTTLLLVTRTPPGSGDDWNREWQVQVERYLPAHQAGERFVDLGPVVDNVCDELVARRPPGGWDRDDLDQRQQIRNAALKVMVLSFAHPKEVEDAGAARCPAARFDLPRWVVESVEIAILRGASLRWNARKLLAVVGDRGGPTAVDWREVADSCRTAWLQPSGIHLEPKPVRAAARLRFFRQLRPSPSEPLTLDGVAFIEVQTGKTDSSKDTTVELVLLGLREGKEVTLASQSLIVPLDRPGLFPYKLAGLQWKTGERPLRVGVQTPEPFFPRSGRVASATDERSNSDTVSVVVSEDVKRWEATILRLQGDPLFREWRERLEAEFQLPAAPDRLRFVINRPAESAGAVVTRQGRSVWIHPPQLKAFPSVENLPIPPDRPGEKPVKFMRCRIGPKSNPGILSWQNIPFVDQPISQVTEPKIMARAWPLVIRDPLPYHFDYTPVELARESQVIATRFRTEVDIEDGNKKTRMTTQVTHVGFDLGEQGCLLNADGSLPSQFEAARFLACWTLVLESIQAVQVMPSGSAESNQSGRLDDDAALFLIEPSDVPTMSEAALRPGILFLAIGIAGYGGFVIRGILSSPKREK